ncbi:hypothetical protein DYE49_01340 [Treponema rectale]|uniref:ATP-dependent DNA helicase RecG n=1 Tax=Treponema rectale TaxID=744512 RepID=A0A7M1XIJ0_9SPIR|nr:hypothetical protein DYE49_01340 [Treponema rectale]
MQTKVCKQHGIIFDMNQRELFTLLEASNDEDILRHFPSRYEDLNVTPLSNDPKDGQRFVVKGNVTNLKSFAARGTSLIRFKVAVFGGALISCILYNQPFYINKLSSHKELCFVMYYSDARKAYLVQSIHDLDSYYVMTGLKPVYNLPKGVSPSFFNNYVKKVLSYPREASYMVSRLPKGLIERYRFLNEFDAYRCVHLPRNKKDLDEGLRVFKYEEALSYCIKALAMKRKANARKRDEVTRIDHDEVNRFVKHLSYKLTGDQISAIRDIVLDMERDTIMYRLLQGDVGTGKTIVAFVSLYANYLRGKQGVLMAPTFELAIQHYENALKVFQDYDIHIGFMAGNKGTAKEKRDILNDLNNGYINILIATHSAISEKVVFKDLGLSIIDEQQLFGVEQREKLLLKGGSNDVLMMSATPIPRTLSQIVNADLDVTTLNQFPHGSRNVETRVIHSQDPLLMKAIEKALSVNRQVFIVAPKISDGTSKANSAESVYKDIEERFKDKVQLLHGKIKKETQDEIIKRFISNEKPILVSTTVIQVGIDVSTACLLIIYDANYFGLSTLHQLRGRVGRSGDFALALLVYDGNEKEAKEKLDFLASSNDGLAIAQFDLKQRGSGSYSGTNQSGKSELMVCNFVDDLKMFEYAKQDASYILDHPSEKDHAQYLKSIDMDEKLNLG